MPKCTRDQLDSLFNWLFGQVFSRGLVMVRTARIVTPVSWVAAPESLKIEQASELISYDLDILVDLIWDGAAEIKQTGDR